MKRDVFERRFPKIVRKAMRGFESVDSCLALAPACAAPAMGLAPGGRMKQEIYDDPFDFDDWDLTRSSRCFVHLTNSLAWRAITGQVPPTIPPTAKQYAQA